MIKAIIFDFDGVIVESVDIKTRAFAELFKDKGEDVVKQVVDYHLQNGGVSRYDKFRYFYSHILKQPLPQQEYERLCNDFEVLVFDGVVACPFVSGVLEFIKNNFGLYRMFIASATPHNELSRILDRRGIAGYFERVFGAPTGKVEAVRLILEEGGFLPEQAIFVGDALSDYLAARSSEVRFIARIQNNEELFADLPCDESIHDFSEFDRILLKLQTVSNVTSAYER